MPVDNTTLIRQTFEMLGNLENTSKDEIASRARLLALALQQAERDGFEAEIHIEVLKEAMKQVLSSVKKHMKVKFKSPTDDYVVDVSALLEEALSPYADSARARSLVKHRKEDKKKKKKKNK